MRVKLLLCGLLVSLLAFTGCTTNTNDNQEYPAQYAEPAPPPAAPVPPPADPPSNEVGALDGEFSFSEGLDENGFWLGINVLDHVEMFNYQALPIPAEVHYVPEHDVQEMVDDILHNHAVPEQIMDRPVQSGDTINIDFVGSIDGEEFDGGNTFGMGTYVTIGVTNFIDDFLDQLVGHLPGTVVNVEVTFPEDYFEESLAGLDALFVTPINYIAGGDVLPDLTNEFVAANFMFLDISTVDELINEIEVVLRGSAVRQYVYEYLSTQIAVTYVPEKLIRHYEQLLLNEYTNEAMQFGMDVDDLLGMIGFESREDFLEANRERVETDAKFSLVLQAVAEDAGIIATMEDVIQFFWDNFNTDDYSDAAAMYGLPWIKQFIRNQMVMDFIYEQVVLS